MLTTTTAGCTRRARPPGRVLCRGSAAGQLLAAAAPAAARRDAAQQLRPQSLPDGQVNHAYSAHAGGHGRHGALHLGTDQRRAAGRACRSTRPSGVRSPARRSAARSGATLTFAVNDSASPAARPATTKLTLTVVAASLSVTTTLTARRPAWARLQRHPHRRRRHGAVHLDAHERHAAGRPAAERRDRRDQRHAHGARATATALTFTVTDSASPAVTATRQSHAWR